MTEKQKNDWSAVRQLSLRCLEHAHLLSFWGERSQDNDYDADSAVLHLAEISEALQVFRDAIKKFVPELYGHVPLISDPLSVASIGEGGRPEFFAEHVCCTTAHEAAFTMLRQSILRIEEAMFSDEINIRSFDKLQQLSGETLCEILVKMEKIAPLKNIISSRQFHQITTWINREWAAIIKGETEQNDATGAGVNAGKKGKKGRATNNDSPAANLIIAALLLHHKYDTGSVGNTEPIGVRDLAKKEGMPKPTTISDFFKIKFGGHNKYKIVCQNNDNLIVSLKLLAGEYPPAILYGKTPPGESKRDE